MEVKRMRTPSMVLGIIGGALSLVLALILVISAVAVFSAAPLLEEYSDTDSWDTDFSFSYDSSDFEFSGLPDSFSRDFTSSVTTSIGGIVIVLAVLAFIAGVLGLVGGIIVRTHNTASGVMMIIAAPLSLFSYFNIVSMTLFIIGAVFALKKERPPYPPYPPYPYPQAPGSAPAPPAYPHAPGNTPAPPTQPKQ
jgi:hypothetical protein